MKYLYELVDLLNQYDGSNREMENRIRDLVCYILDSSEYMQIDLYRSIVFEAAQKLRMFGYIKGTNRIAQDEFFYDNLNDINIQQFKIIINQKCLVIIYLIKDKKKL